jgi:hypothetical protein
MTSHERTALAIAALAALIASGQVQAQPVALTRDVTATQSIGNLPTSDPINGAGLGPLTAIKGGATNPTLATNTGSSTTSIDAFNANLGVLTGVSGTLTVLNPSTSFLTSAVPSVASQAAITSTWSLGGIASAATVMAVATQPRNDPIYVSSNSWSNIVLSGGANPAVLNGFVGSTPLTSSVSSRLDVALSTIAEERAYQAAFATYIANGSKGKKPTEPWAGNNNVSIAGYITKTGATADTNAIDPQVSAAVTYTYLNHANASLVSTADVYLGAKVTSVDLLAKNTADANATGFDVSVKCIDGDCPNFQFTPGLSFSNIASGTKYTGLSLGQFSVVGDLGNYTSTFAITFSDTAGIGASTSRWTHTTNLTVESGIAPAVPEPHSAAMLLAGLGAIGWMSRRRRSARDQVAKL